MVEQKNIGDRIITLRQAAGLTQEELAEKSQMSTRTIQRIESNQVTPRAYTLRVLSEVLQEDLFSAEESLSTQPRNQHTLLWYLMDLFNFKTNKMQKISILSTTVVSICLAFFLMSGSSPTNGLEKAILIPPSSGLSVLYDDENNLKTIDVVFNNQQTLDSLISMRDDLKNLGIELSYSSMEFTDAGTIKSLGYTVSDGKSKGSANIILNDLAVLGFYFDYTKSRKRDFCVGGCWTMVNN